jgi:hypothetical protein
MMRPSLSWQLLRTIGVGMRLGPAVALLLGLLVASPHAAAQDGAGADAAGDAQTLVKAGGLSLAIDGSLRAPRARAPLPIGISIHSDGDQRTGHLRLVIQEGGQTLITWRSPEWTVSQAPRSFDVLMPPLPIDAMHAELTALPVWEEGSQQQPMPPLRLALAGNNERQLVLGWCAGAGGDRRSALAATSIQDVLASATPREWTMDARVQVQLVPVERLPGEGLALCAYDLLALSADALNRLDAHQLQALVQWLHGGGALAIIAHGEQVAGPAAAMLAGLGHESGMALLAGEDHLPSAGAARLARIGLGRLAVVQPVFAGTAADRAAPLFLWRVRETWAASLAHGGALDAEELEKAQEAAGEAINQNYSTYNVPVRHRHGAKGDESATYPSFVSPSGGVQDQALSQLLMPAGIGTVPFSLVAAIIIGFALAIGPGDWLLLGRFKAHRFTWILFPVLSIACTVLLMLLADRYLGGSEHRVRLAIIDQGAQGTVLRRDTIEEIFSGHARVVGSELEHSLWSPLSSGSNAGMSRMGNGAMNQEGDETKLVEGQMPVRFTAMQAVPQWSPSLRRALSFSPGGAGDVPPLNLDQELTPAQLPAYAERLAGQHPGLVLMRWLGGDQQLIKGSMKDLMAATAAGSSESGTEVDQGMLARLCCAPTAGWTALVGGIAPAGGDTLEDVPVYDTSDTHRWLLVACLRQDTVVWMLRRIYTLDATAPSASGTAADAPGKATEP